MAFTIFETIPVTITSGTAVSSTANIQGRDIVGISMSAGWDAAALTFQASPDGQTFQDVFTPPGGSEQSYTVAANRYYPISWGSFSGMQALKLRSGTTATPVNQTANRVIGVVVRSHL